MKVQLLLHIISSLIQTFIVPMDQFLYSIVVGVGAQIRENIPEKLFQIFIAQKALSTQHLLQERE